jgi:hypothetical protein
MRFSRAIFSAAILAIGTLPASGGVAPAMVVAKATVEPAVKAEPAVTPSDANSMGDPAKASRTLFSVDKTACGADSLQSEQSAAACVPWGRLCDPYQQDCCGSLQCHFDGFSYSCRF